MIHCVWRYGNDGLSTKAIERVFDLANLNPWSTTYGKLSYRDFVCFMISEEDKLSPRGIYFWFQVLDLDGACQNTACDHT